MQSKPAVIESPSQIEFCYMSLSKFSNFTQIEYTNTYMYLYGYKYVYIYIRVYVYSLV